MKQNELGQIPTELFAKATADWLMRSKQDGLSTVSIAWVDQAGDLKYFYRMNAAPARTITIALAKAYTAVRMNASSLEFRQRLQRENLCTSDFMDDKLCALPGGVLIMKQSKIFGAVGVSGLSLEQDHELATKLAQRLVSAL